MKSEGVHVKLKCTLEVSCLVLVDDIVFSQFIQHGGDFRQESFSGTLLRRIAQCLHGITGRLVIKTIVRTLAQRLTDPFLR